LEVEPRPLNNGDALLGLRASAPGRIGGAGATHRAAMTTMPLEQSPNPDGGVGRVSRAATSDATSEGQIWGKLQTFREDSDRQLRARALRV